jgi:hypothetical protein
VLGFAPAWGLPLFKNVILVSALALFVMTFAKFDDSRLNSAWATASDAVDPVINFCRDNARLCQTAKAGYRNVARALEVGAGVASGQGELVYVPKSSSWTDRGNPARNSAKENPFLGAAFGPTGTDTSWVSNSNADRTRSDPRGSQTCR